MEPPLRNPIPLGYATRTNWRDRRAARLISRVPLWLIALLLLLPVWIFDHFNILPSFSWDARAFDRYGAHFLYFAALFLPGSIKRLNWRHALIMLPLSATLCGLDLARSSFLATSEIPILFGLAPVIAILGVTLGEQLFLPKRNGKSIVWAAIALAAGCTVQLIDSFLDFTGRTSSFHLPAIGGWLDASWAYLRYPPLVAVFAWISIPLGQKLPLMKRRAVRPIAGAAALSLIAIYVLFFQVWMYGLAIDALRGSGPFGRGMAVATLQKHDGPSARAAFWYALETADWSQPESYTGGNEYRKYCIEVLAARDPHGTARRLAELLRQHPSQVLARFSAKLLGDEKLYDTIPILTRFALLDNSACAGALERMNLPVAALAILRHAAVWHAIGVGPNPQDFPLDTYERMRLTKLLGRDAGPNLSDWTRYYDQVANTLPSPLSPPQSAETQRVVAAFVSYWNAAEALENAADRLSIRLLADDGRSGVAGQVQAITKMAAGSRRLTDAQVRAAGFDPTVVDIAADYLDRARKEMTVAPPNWDAPDTAALEKEVQEYNARVNAMIAKFHATAATSTASP